MKLPQDFEEANMAWGANCGPFALAAALEVPLVEVKPFLGEFKGYMTPTAMLEALDKEAKICAVKGPKVWPNGRALLFLQMGGYEHLPTIAQYQHTHWIAVNGDLVADVNSPDKLLTKEEWDKTIPAALKGAGEGNGTYWIRAAIVLSLPD